MRSRAFIDSQYFAQHPQGIVDRTVDHGASGLATERVELKRTLPFRRGIGLKALVQGHLLPAFLGFAESYQ